MATVIVHDVDDEALEHLRTEAERRGGSVEDELRTFIATRARVAESARGRTHVDIAELRAGLDQLRAKYGNFPDTTEMIRQDREAW